MDAGDDGVIDLSGYLRRKEEESSRTRTTFSFWGGEGERARFALPLWRAAYLASGRRAGLLWQRSSAVAGEEPVYPLVVLDLGEEPARTAFAPSTLVGLGGVDAPGTVGGGEGRIAVYLGEVRELKWYLLVDDLDEPRTEVVGRSREDLLFLAGECAGLLFHRGLGSEAGEGERGR